MLRKGIRKESKVSGAEDLFVCANGAADGAAAVEIYAALLAD